MSTDRELLELAAKAAGLTIRDSTRWPNTVVRQITMDDGSPNWVRWNPRNDDGDGARLEAALGIDVEWHNVGVRCAKLTGAWCDDVVARESFDDHNGDKQAARRLASLRVAASIGRAMP